MKSYEPLVGGLRLGGLVEVHGLSQADEKKYAKPVNGVYGQVVSYTGGDENTFCVHLSNGMCGHFGSKNVRMVASPKRPGQGGGESSFDLLLAPRTSPFALGQELSRCLLEKGFCVMKQSQNDDAKVQQTVKFLQDAAGNGNLGRFPEECEAGYLGTGCHGKVVWMDDDVPELAGEEILKTCDSNLSMLGQVLQPFSYDLLREWVDERSPALVCLSMKAGEEKDWPYPEPDDDTLGVFLQTWRRTQVRAVHFLGPGTADIELTVKDKQNSPILPIMQPKVTIKAAPNTILLFRVDAYEYKCSAPEETLMLITNFLSRGPQYKIEKLEGNLNLLQRDGPPPPPGDKGLHVMNLTTRLPANMDMGAVYLTGLTAGTDAVSEVPFTRWDVDKYWSPTDDHFEVNQTTTKHQSLCEGAELFDNRYFEISVAEARGMDPVQRMVLEAGAHSMAMNGLTKKSTARKHVHAGFAVGNDRLDWMSCTLPEGSPLSLGNTSTQLSVIANRFSFVFNLRGPNFVCDSSCSASLCATHCAKLMMLDQKFDPLEFFLTMGAHLCLSVGPFIACSQAHMTSPQGRCFTFDQSANGYCRGEGISGFLMKYGNLRGKSEAMLRATQVGQDGRSASLTAPNGPAQEEMITRTLREAEMTPLDSTAWECNGKGVALGDPIEVGAVRKIQVRMQRSEPLLMASHKSNIGHLEGGSAMSAMCKCIVQVRHALGFAGLHVQVLNPHVEHDSFYSIFQTHSMKFSHAQGNSQVTSLGHGGTNGHAIFWGESAVDKPNLPFLWAKKVATRAAPEVRPLGPPEAWEADFPDSRTLRNGTLYNITLERDDPEDKPIKFELKEEAPDPDVEDVGNNYSISANFNGWGQDSMASTDVAGLFRYSVEVPESGTVEWRFLKNGEVNEVIGPKISPCKRRTEAIVGPTKGLKNKWVIYEEVGRKVTIDFFCKRGMRSVTWLVSKD